MLIIKLGVIDWQKFQVLANKFLVVKTGYYYRRFHSTLWGFKLFCGIICVKYIYIKYSCIYMIKQDS
jgi:hypothetical protein